MPKQLKSKWPNAAFFAAALAPKDARIGVIVVPILLPNTIAQPISKDIHPFIVIIITIANAAADDWIIIVITMPASKKIHTERKPMSA